jgi:3',5'-cyclic AMP phosphodiesterase CpdA
MRTIVHLSDLHFGRLDPQIVRPLVEAIATLAPHLVAVSGDLTQRARRREFLDARAFLQRLPCPQIIVPGNHDVPLYNVAARFVRPLAGFGRYITRDLEPVFVDEEMIVVGLNSARSVLFGRGRLNWGQVHRAAARLIAAPPRVVKIVVTHHPFELPEGHDEGQLIGRSQMAMDELAPAGADVFLAGHLHLSHLGRTADRYTVAGHDALVVQAGTMSTRGRGELNTFNVVRIARPQIMVERHTWDDRHATFLASRARAFEDTPRGWTALPT